MHGHERGTGTCLLTGEILEALRRHDCADWQLAPMHMVRSRSKRRIVYDRDNFVTLE